jgi:chemotaxis protein MotB
MFSLAEKDGLYQALRVEGHTDKRPISTARYPSNWDLSVDRALKVASYIRSTELLDNSKLTLVGYGEERPRIDEDTPDAYAKNRRVEFVAEAAPQVNRPAQPATEYSLQIGG